MTERQRRILAVSDEIKQFKDRNDNEALKFFRAVLERKDTKPGPKREDRWKIKTLRELASGKPLKQAAPDAVQAQRWSVALVRFCREVYEECSKFDSDSLLPHPYLIDMLQLRFGFQFPADMPAVKEAYRRGKRSHDKKAKPAR